MPELETEEPQRTKPSDVAMAEHQTWKQGVGAAKAILKTCLQVRIELLDLGFPVDHALCKEIDQDAARWAGRAEQMRRDMVAHAELNQIEL
jgi:hypothetical protein